MMRVLFLIGLALGVFTEILRVYFIMPMPGSQSLNYLDVAYFLHQWIWIFRGIALILITLSVKKIWPRWKYLSVLLLLFYALVAVLFNFKLSADKMFLMPKHLNYADNKSNQVDTHKLVIGYSFNGEAKAWPLQYIAYHHQVRDSVGGEPVMVTYCSVCRTGRVFSPKIDQETADFRLVGMDHFNAMFEDSKTGSWWRQVNGVCVQGPSKGKKLRELMCSQVPLNLWVQMHPQTLIMQTDSSFINDYNDLNGFEEGVLESSLEGTDTGSWQEKSWVLGAVIDGKSICWDWKRLVSKGSQDIQINQKNYRAFIEPNGKHFGVYELKRMKGDSFEQKTVQSYQEFWHSWRTFHPHTMKAN